MKHPFDRLLLATEHGEFDTGAEALGLAMAQRCQLPLPTVIPLLSNPEYEALAPQIAARAELEAGRRISDLRTMAQAKGVAIDLHLRRGEEPYQEIIAEAQRQASNLIIIRRRGRRGFLANLLVGEMVTKVVAHAPCHVLIVPRQATMWSNKILAAVEPNALGQAVAALAASVAQECSLPLHLVTVVHSPAEQAPASRFVEAMAEGIRQRVRAVEVEACVGVPYEQVLAAARRTGADLIVLASHGDRHLGRALVGGVAQKVMGLSDVPVLVMKPPGHSN